MPAVWGDAGRNFLCCTGCCWTGIYGTDLLLVVVHQVQLAEAREIAATGVAAQQRRCTVCNKSQFRTHQREPSIRDCTPLDQAKGMQWVRAASNRVTDLGLRTSSQTQQHTHMQQSDPPFHAHATLRRDRGDQSGVEGALQHPCSTSLNVSTWMSPMFGRCLASVDVCAVSGIGRCLRGVWHQLNF